MSASYCSLSIPVDASGLVDVSGILMRVGQGTFSYVNPTFPNNLQGSTFFSLNGFLFQVGDIPPPCFFTINGIYSQRFIQPMQSTFDRLYAQQQLLNPLLVDPFNNRRGYTFVQQMSISQQRQYSQQLTLFRQVYAFNLEAYRYAAITGTTPIYYRFETSSALILFRDAAALVNKLYNVSVNYPVTSLFFLPFPPFCN
jgi:hypothetical protein